MKRIRQRGASLIELIVAIVIVAAAGSTIIALLASISRGSADAMDQSKRASIAYAYLSEILAQPFANPDGAAANRASANSVNDYPACLDSVVRDRYGNAIAGLEAYSVAVTVTAQAFNGIPSAQARLVRVQVTSAFGGATVLSGFKTSRP